MDARLKVAVVHHWFVTRGGGEKVAETMASLFPGADLFSLVSDAAGFPESLKNRRLRTSFLQRLPFGPANHRHLMPFYPEAVEGLDLRGYDLVLSSDSGPIKGVRVDAGSTHICYCHSPMRYLHDGYEAYRAQMGGLTRFLFTATADRVRRWDLEAAKRVTYFLANSAYVAERISRIYTRESTIIHPPIDLGLARLASPGEHYLCAGRLVGYKRTDLLIEACRRLGRRLIVAGTGPEVTALRRASGSGVEFTGELSDDALWQHYAECRALLFAADEDFGMVPLEAQACGRPVICYGAGGSLETVRGTGRDATGVYFAEQTVESVMDGILRFEARGAELRPGGDTGLGGGIFDPDLPGVAAALCAGASAGSGIGDGIDESNSRFPA